MRFLKIFFSTSMFFAFLILSTHAAKVQADEIKIPDHCGLLAGVELSTDELKECLKIYREAYDTTHPEEVANQNNHLANPEQIAGYEPQMRKSSYEPQMKPAAYEPQMKPVGYEPQMRGNPKGYEPQMNKANSYYRY